MGYMEKASVMRLYPIKSNTTQHTELYKRLYDRHALYTLIITTRRRVEIRNDMR